MKKLVLLIAMLLPLFSMAQFTTTNPDTVCIGSINPSTYQVVNTVGYTYTWTANGNILTGQGTNQITVNWSSAPSGLINNAVSVFATSPDGCASQIVYLNVLIYNILPTIVPLEFCQGDPCEPLIGTPAGGVWSGVGVVNGTFCPTTAGTSSVTYTVTVDGCSFSTTINNFVVNPTPVLLNISHN